MNHPWWSVIAFETTADAPYHSPSSFAVAQHGAYMKRLVSAFSHPLNHDHRKFCLNVELNLRTIECAVNTELSLPCLTPSSSPALGSQDDAAGVQRLWGKYTRAGISGGTSRQRLHQGGGTSIISVIDSILSIKSGVLAVAAASGEFRRLLELYTRFLAVVRQVEGNNRKYAALDKNHKKFIERLLMDVWTQNDDQGSGNTLQRGGRNVPTLRLGFMMALSEKQNTNQLDDATSPAEPDDAENGSDDDCAEDDAMKDVEKADEKPGRWLESLAVVHRWSFTRPASGLIPPSSSSFYSVTSLAPLMKAVLSSPTSLNEEDENEAGRWLVDVHTKSLYHYVAWSTVIVDRFCVQPRPRAQVGMFVSSPSYYSPQESPTALSSPASSGFVPLPEQALLQAWSLIREKQQLVFLLGAAQAEFSDSECARDYCLLMRAFCRRGLVQLQKDMHKLDVESGKMRRQEGAANEESVWSGVVPKLLDDLVVPRFAEELQVDAGALRIWIEKCQAMELTEEEAAWAAQHPVGAGDLTAISIEEKQERDQKLARTDASEEASSTREAMDSDSSSIFSSLSLSYFCLRRRYVLFRCLATYRMKLPFFHFVTNNTLLAERRPVAQRPFWKDVAIGEFDGLLLDLRENECLLCFEIKANPADLAKAHDQRRKFGQALEPCVARRALNNPCDPVNPVLPCAIVVTPQLDCGRRHPFYDTVFPLSESSFCKRFATAHALMRNWVIVTNITLQGPAAAVAASAPPFYAPSNGKIRHVLVSCCAKVVAAALFLSQPSRSSPTTTATSSPKGDGISRPDYSKDGVLAAAVDVSSLRLDAGSCKSVFSQVFFATGRGKKAATADPNTVFAELSAENALGNIIWVPKWSSI
jgi:hypothetical protein